MRGRRASGGGATVLEHYTYRMEGHSTSDDPTKYRPLEEPDAWPYGDPIKRLRDHLILIEEWDSERQEALEAEIKAKIRVAYKAAEKHGSLATGTKIDPMTMFEQVYEDLPRHIREQRDEFKLELE